MIVGDLKLFPETFDIIKKHFESSNIISENEEIDMDAVEDVIMSSDYIRSYYYAKLMTYFFEFKISGEMNSLSFNVNCIDSPDKGNFDIPDFGATFDLFTESRRQIRINSFVSFTVSGNYSWKYLPSVAGIIDAEGYLPVFDDNGIEQAVNPDEGSIYTLKDFRDILDPIRYRHSLKIIRIEK